MIIAEITVTVREREGVNLDEDVCNAICDSVERIDLVTIVREQLRPLDVNGCVVIAQSV